MRARATRKPTRWLAPPPARPSPATVKPGTTGFDARSTAAAQGYVPVVSFWHRADSLDKFGFSRLAAGQLLRDSSAHHDQDPLGEPQDLVQIRRTQHQATAAVCQFTE